MKVGVLVGRELTFPPALIEEINHRQTGVTAEYLCLGGIRMDQPCPYRVIVDRISHEVPFYRAYLKVAALGGATIVNNPFWWSADDKFFNYSIAHRLGVAIPRTVLLPQKSYKDGVVSESLRNLEYPLDWQAIIDYVGLPAIMKPFDGGGWRDVYKVSTFEELIDRYDQTNQLCMTLQQMIDFDRYVRCYVVGRSRVRVMPYDPRLGYGQNYLSIAPEVYLEPGLLERIEHDAVLICETLGYDMNTVEFAIQDGIPYAIDYLNPAPDAELASVKEPNFLWIVREIADLAIEYALHGKASGAELRWSRFLSSSGTRSHGA